MITGMDGCIPRTTAFVTNNAAGLYRAAIDGGADAMADVAAAADPDAAFCCCGASVATPATVGNDDENGSSSLVVCSSSSFDQNSEGNE